MATLRTASGASTHPDALTAVNEAWRTLTGKLAKPDVLVAMSTVGYPLQDVFDAIKQVAPDTRIQGGSSCGGVMTDEGFFGVDGRGLALFGISDEDGDYGVGVAPIGDSPRAAAAEAVRRAMADAGCEGEMPSAVWLMTTPGGEEEVVRGIEDVVGSDVPLVGGSAADNTIGGNWRQFSTDGVHESSISVLVIYTGAKVTSAFHSGYDSTVNQGLITKADGRLVQEIDGKAASRVYNEWTSGALNDVVDEGGELLALTNLHPLGRKVGAVKGIDYFLLSHPERAFKDGSIQLFTDIAVGEQLVCMTGTVDALVDRAGNVVRSAMQLGELAANDTSAALIIFCGGCFLTVKDRIGEVHANLVKVMEGKPFITAFTFGEQGRVLGGGNRHGNLMISSLLLGQAA